MIQVEKIVLSNKFLSNFEIEDYYCIAQTPKI